MKNLTIMLLLITLGCGQSTKDTINIITHTIRADVHTKAVSSYSDDYLEIGLYSMNEGTSFIAQKYLEPFTAVDGKANMVRLYIVENGDDNSAEPKAFNTSTDFLNYMSARGYEMVDQVKEKHRTDYTFKTKD